MSVHAKSRGPARLLLRPPNLPGHPNPPLRHISVGSCQGPLLAPLVPRARMERHGGRSSSLHPPPLALAAIPRELLLRRASCYVVQAHYLATRARCPVARATTPPPRHGQTLRCSSSQFEATLDTALPDRASTNRSDRGFLGRVPVGSDGPPAACSMEPWIGLVSVSVGLPTARMADVKPLPDWTGGSIRRHGRVHLWREEDEKRGCQVGHSCHTLLK